ncbi:MAG TPA: N,N-dimethylformamidase beta subunit family domain-containing protein [Gaiellaceae bacterium]|nr:N,N-dimethylformamidase beta subunit family domain-containing protein [Gaiellaceae bacterium]
MPGAPTGAAGTAGNGSVNLSWTAPSSNGGSAITGYRVTPYVNGTAQTPILTASTNTGYTVTSLTNGTAYTFTVAAINAVGIGPDSTASAAVTPAPTAPGAPTSVSGSAGDASIALIWAAPTSNGGSSITGYRITPYVNGTAQTPVLTGSAATSYTVTGLTNGTAYTFTVAAINSAGTGAESAASAAVTPVQGVTVPGAPTGLSGAPGDETAALTWTAPASNGGSAIIGYVITPYIAGTAQGSVLTGSTATSFTVSGLANGTTYTFTVAAINAVGPGLNSAPSNPVTPIEVETPPDPPTNVVGTPGNGSIVVSWTAPAENGGSPVSGYKVTPYVNGTAQTTILTGSSATSYTVNGLTNGTAYTFTVAAVNAIGTGTASAQSSPVTPAASKYPSVVFSDGFESGSLSAWDGFGGTGSSSVIAAAAHSGNDGLRLTNSAAGQYGVLVKTLSSALSDSSVSFWMRVNSGAGVQTVAQARDQGSSSTMWALLYDGSQHGFYFYPYKGSSATEIFTGANSAAVGQWVKVEVQYTATSTGGAQLFINGQTQLGWGVTGNYTRSTNFQKLQLWDDVTNTTDFDDVTVAVPAGSAPSVPAAPTGVAGTAGNGSVALTWTAPSSDGGSAITGYRVTPYVNGTSQTPILTSSTTTSYTVNGLTNGTAYTFTVAAINTVGTGADSAASAPVTPAGAASVPGAPTGVSGTAGDGSVALTWTAPASNGSAITGYIVTPYVAGTAQGPVLTGSTATTFTVTGLTDGTTYTFTVAAINSVGIGPNSTQSSGVTPMAPTPPGAPTGLVATGGDGTAALTWAAPTSSGSSPITGYRVTPYINGTAQTAIQTGSTATSYTVTGLTDGTTYTFTVAAINSVGASAESAPSSAVTPAALNPIQIENNQPGDPSWGDFDQPNDPTQISGYGSRISVNHGQSLDFYVTTTASTVTMDVFRMGWYGGAGARLMKSLGTFPGVNQPQANPDTTYGMVVENWTKTTTLNVPSTWTTGVYLVRLLASNGYGAFIFFVVRNDGGHEPILFQTSTNTYQAYNPYGGTSLYNNNTNKAIWTAPHAMKVSYDRPFETGDGAGQFLWYEYPYVRWLEKNGYNVAYTTDVDTDTNASTLTNHKAFLVVGHDEYWSKGMRDNVEGAIASGVNVGFFAGNESYWQVRFEPNAAGVADRVMVGYKDYANCACPPGPDPMWNVNNAVLTTLWRDPQVNRPEEKMMGVMFGGETNNSPYIVSNASNWVFNGTGWTNGTSIPGIVGYEYDHYFGDANTPPGTTVLSNTPLTNTENNQPDTANSTIYTAPSGAMVFDAGTIQWSYGLDNFGGTTFVNAGIQRVTANILARFAGP